MYANAITIMPTSNQTNQWRPSEILIHKDVVDDPVTKSIVKKCNQVPVRVVRDSKYETIHGASSILSLAGNSMLEKINAGKRIIFVAPASGDIADTSGESDDRIVCPSYDRIKLASNGCFYRCDWCYLKLTYRARFPYITVRVEYDRIIQQLEKKLSKSLRPILFSSGDLADSLSLEHLTGAARKFIPWFGATENGYLYMLTKSDNVDDILDLPHNGHTIMAWSLNSESISRKFERGAPTFRRRLTAARRVQQAGYPLRLRLDPIVPVDGWKRAYCETVKMIFNEVQPERMTIGTLRFEDSFYKMRHKIFESGSELPDIVEDMVPMFEAEELACGKQSIGKYTFPEDKRVEIYGFIINEIRKYSDCTVALCKESEAVWRTLGLNPSRCSCVCQFN